MYYHIVSCFCCLLHWSSKMQFLPLFTIKFKPVFVQCIMKNSFYVPFQIIVCSILNWLHMIFQKILFNIQKSYCLSFSMFDHSLSWQRNIFLRHEIKCNHVVNTIGNFSIMSLLIISGKEKTHWSRQSYFWIFEKYLFVWFDAEFFWISVLIYQIIYSDKS